MRTEAIKTPLYAFTDDIACFFLFNKVSIFTTELKL